VQDGDVGDGNIDGHAGVEVAAVVLGESGVGWGKEDGAVDFIAGWHFGGWVGWEVFWWKGMYFRKLVRVFLCFV